LGPKHQAERSKSQERGGGTGRKGKWWEEYILQEETNFSGSEVSQAAPTRRSDKCRLEKRVKCWEVKFIFFSSFIGRENNFSLVFALKVSKT
jgi:hypothetical protein